MASVNVYLKIVGQKLYNIIFSALDFTLLLYAFLVRLKHKGQYA